MKQIRVDLGDFLNNEAETYANFVRRSLLFGDSGYAPIGVKINEGEAKTVFQIIDGLVEDLIQVYGRLTNAVYQGNGIEFDTLGVHVRNKKIFVKDLSNSNITVKSEEVLATITGDRDFSIEVYVLNSRGSRTEDYNREYLEKHGVKGAIVFGSRHSSIDAVGYKIIPKENGMSNVIMNITTTSDNIKLQASTIFDQAINRIDEIKSRF